MKMPEDNDITIVTAFFDIGRGIYHTQMDFLSVLLGQMKLISNIFLIWLH